MPIFSSLLTIHQFCGQYIWQNLTFGEFIFGGSSLKPRHNPAKSNESHDLKEMLDRTEKLALAGIQSRHEHPTEMRVLRRIVEKRWVDRVINVEIREELQQEGMLEKVKKIQRRWREALEKMGPDRLVKKVYQAEMEGRRGRGRPRKRWNDILGNDMLMRYYRYETIM